MSVTEIENETTVDGMIRREFQAEATVGDGRTVDVRIVPYGEQIQCNDGLGDVPKGVVYREEWSHGCFAHQLNAANRVLANAEHQEGILGIVGHGVALRDSPEGLYGTFKIHETPAGDTALILIKEGVFSTVSLEARPRKSVRIAGGVIRRTRGDLIGMAFSRFGAYKGAQVLAVREEAELIDEELLPVDIDPALIERVRALGIKLPDRYQAHPDETGTPEESGTPDEAPADHGNHVIERGSHDGSDTERAQAREQD